VIGEMLDQLPLNFMPLLTLTSLHHLDLRGERQRVIDLASLKRLALLRSYRQPPLKMTIVLWDLYLKKLDRKKVKRSFHARSAKLTALPNFKVPIEWHAPFTD